MHERYRMYKRKSGVFYAKDRKTGRRLSLATNELAEAKRLLAAKNQATEQPCLNVAMARVYLRAQSPEFVSRTWGHLIELVAQGYESATAVRWRKFATSAPLKLLVELPLWPKLLNWSQFWTHLCPNDLTCHRKYLNSNGSKLAEGVGFEPTVTFRLRQFSRLHP